MTEKELMSLPVGTWVMADLGGPLIVAQRIGVPVRKDALGYLILTDGDPDDPGGILIKDPRMASLPTRELIDRWRKGREGPINEAILNQLERQLGKQGGKE
jgi:hypothetical protein